MRVITHIFFGGGVVKMRVITHISRIGAFQGIFWGCVPSFEYSVWYTLNSINFMYLQRFFRGVYQQKAKSQLAIGKCAFMHDIC
jgi:hypothetical protein